MIRVYIIDDHPVVRKGIRSLLGEFADIEVVGESDGGPESLTACTDAHPDIVLLDIRLEFGDGLSLYSALRREKPTVKVIILTAYDDETYLNKALRIGVQGYLLKSSSSEILVDTIRAVNAGERRISNSLMSAALRSIEQMNNNQSNDDSGLNEEEIRLLQLLASGASNQAVASQLYLSERTIKRKLHDLFGKLGASTRAMAVAEGYNRGIL
jgi:DNA-binding NarL/FixJ family response regulator